jgi:hypothetical protein
MTTVVTTTDATTATVDQHDERHVGVIDGIQCTYDSPSTILAS